MKILFAIKSIAVPGGGAERALVLVANELTRREHEVTVLTFDGHEESFYPLDSAIERVGLSIGDIGVSTPRGDLLSSLPRIRRVIKSVRPDVAVASMHSMFIPLGVANIHTGVPLVATEQIARVHYATRPLEKLLLELTPWISVVTTIPTEGVRQSYPARLRRRMVAIPNPIEVPDQLPTDTCPEGPPTVLTIGRLFDQKNHKVLLSAFAQIANEFRDWHLRIVGEGELRGALEQQVTELGLEDRISLPGVVSDTATEYARADIFALPSTYESFGLVTAEALAAGKPVVGFADCPGTNELIRHEQNGLLMGNAPDRVTAFAEGLRRLMRDPRLRSEIAAAGPASVADFAVGPVTDRWERLLARIIETGR